MMGRYARFVLRLAIVSVWTFGPASCSQPPQSAQLPGADTRTSRASPSPAPPRAGEGLLDIASLSAPMRPRAVERRAWPACSFVVAADVDGNGNDEVLCWDNGGLAFWNAGDDGPFETMLPATEVERRIAGVPNLAVRADIDRDGRDDVIIGFGMGSGKTRVPIQVLALRVKGANGNHRRVARLLYQATSYRPQVVGLAVEDLEGASAPEILLAHYDSKYYVKAFVLSLSPGRDPIAGSLHARQVARIRMAASWATGVLPHHRKASLFVGRPYGDKKLEPGDLFLLRGRKRVAIPSHLGVRSVAFGDADGDGTPEVVFGDGWHHEYGRKAKARLSIAHLDHEAWASRSIWQSPGEYEIHKIRIADVDQDGKPEIVVAGNRYVSLVWYAEGRWMTKRLASGKDFDLARFGGVWHLVVPGAPIRVISLDAGRDRGQPVPADPAG